MEFIVFQSGQVIHESPLLPGAVETPVGIPAIEGEGAGEHLGENDVQGWKIALSSLEDLLRLVESVGGQVTIRAPRDFMLGGRPAFVLDVTPGVGQSG